jgi:hypothetical protein
MDWLPTLLGVALVACAAAIALLPLVRGAPEPYSSSATEPVSVDRLDLYRQVLELECHARTAAVPCRE